MNSIAHAKSQSVTVFTGRCLVTARKNEDSSVSVLRSFMDSDWVTTHSWRQLPALLTAKLLLGFANTLILGSGSHGNHDHILLPDGSGSLADPIPGLSALIPVIQPRAGLPSKDRLSNNSSDVFWRVKRGCCLATARVCWCGRTSVVKLFRHVTILNHSGVVSYILPLTSAFKISEFYPKIIDLCIMDVIYFSE
jgi:hypothetical protein